MVRNKKSFCNSCNCETKELFEDLKSTKWLCKNCSDKQYRKFDEPTQNTKPYVPKKFK